MAKTQQPATIARNTVTQGDCVKLLPKLAADSVDLVFADPPFNIGDDYDVHDDNMDEIAYLTWTAEWLTEAAHVLKKTGSLWICVSEEMVSEVKILAQGKAGLAYADDVLIARGGRVLKPRHHVIWYYTFGVNCPKKLTRSHTHLLHFVRSLKHHQWNTDAVRLPSARQAIYGDKRAAAAGRLPDDTWIIRPPADGFEEGHDVIHQSRVCGTFKEKEKTANQMPEQLVARIVRLCTSPGDLIVDPFSGSGTTAAVAKKLNREFVAFEKSPDYVLQSHLRIEAARAGAMLDAPDPPFTPSPPSSEITAPVKKKKPKMGRTG